MIGQETDGNLLFGVLALELELIDERQFAEACTDWGGGRGGSMAEVLLGRGWIKPGERLVVDHLIGRRLARHDGDAHRALAAAVDGRVAGSLAGVDDLGIRSTLGELVDRAAGPIGSTLDWPADSRGHYPLVHLHGRGGLGRVWLARDPVIGRSVALKEILPERADDPAHRARFLAEARITGQLQHPSIVPVYELSRRPEDGRPFYTMRMVRGRTLSAAVRAHHARADGCRGDTLELSGLLGAFVSVCNAIAYAHSRGVIHRDLKGANIVLGDFGEVIVLDWGLAKLVDRPEGDWPEPVVALESSPDSAITLHGQAIGTPGYMPPEQADGRHELVGRASDIYGLGAVLYEILTGQPPFETAATPEAVRQVCERDPEPPRRVCTATPPALEAVCLKALSRRPGDRYATATELADDVRRWMADEPVSAWREPASARWARWGRRHRAAVNVAAGFVLVGLVGLAAGLVGLGRERARSEAHFRLARDEAGLIYREILGDPLLDRPGMDLLRRKILAREQTYYGKLAAARPGDAEVGQLLGWSHVWLARVMLQMGDLEDAAEQARLARRIFERLADDHPESETYRSDTATAHFELGEIHRQSERLSEAEAELAAAARVWADLGPGRDGRPRPQLATSYDYLGAIDLKLGRTDRAIERHEKALALWLELARDRDPEMLSRLAFCRLSMGRVRARRREWGEAESSFLEACDLLREVIPRRDDTADRKRLGYALDGLGHLYMQTGRITVADRALTESLGIWVKLEGEHPAVVEYGGNRADDHRILGELYDPSLHPPGDARRAEREYTQAAGLLEEMVRRVPDPQRPALRARLATTLDRLAKLCRTVGPPDRADEYERRARQAIEGGRAPDPPPGRPTTAAPSRR